MTGNTAGHLAGTSLALNVVHEFAGAGAVELTCNDSGVNASICTIKITASKLGT